MPSMSISNFFGAIDGLCMKRDLTQLTADEEEAIAITKRTFHELGRGVLDPKQKILLRRLGVDLTQDAQGDRYRELMGHPTEN